MQPALPDEISAQFEALFRFVGSAAVRGTTTDAFMQSFYKNAALLAPSIFATAPDQAARTALCGELGRGLWSVTPQPAMQWRAQSVAKPERNEPCPCGSGRKYKQCCAAQSTPELPLAGTNMLAYVIDAWPEARRNEIPLARLLPAALANVCLGWAEDGRAPDAIDLLRRLFESGAALSDAHAECADALLQIFLDLEDDEARALWAERLAAHPNKFIASAALQRAATMASDRQAFALAWRHFQRAMRLTPDAPALSHLEIIMLVREGRQAEANARAAFWATKLRKSGVRKHLDLADFLIELAKNPQQAMAGRVSADDADARDWLAMIATAPSVQNAYRVQSTVSEATDGEHDGKASRPSADIAANNALAVVERQWRAGFAVNKPNLTDLTGEAEDVAERLDDVAAFMKKHPLAWQSFEVLDDLVLACVDSFDEPFLASSIIVPLTDRALALVKLALGCDVKDSVNTLSQKNSLPIVEWARLPHRPLLRLIAQRIAMASSTLQPAGEVMSLQSLMLHLNPNDNHGYRYAVMRGLLETRAISDALALAARYPDEPGQLRLDTVLALFMADQKLEAETAWRTAAVETPLTAKTLLRPPAKPPKAVDEPYYSTDDAVYAYDYQQASGSLWRESGALAWVASLKVKIPAVRRASGTRAAAPKPVSRHDTADALQQALTSLPTEAALLDTIGKNGWPVAKTHGFICGVALSPSMLMPSVWMQPLMTLRAAGSLAATMNEMNEWLTPLMALYNTINVNVRAVGTDGKPFKTIDGEHAPVRSEQEAVEWAKGMRLAIEIREASWTRHFRSEPSAAALKTVNRAAIGVTEGLTGGRTTLNAEPGGWWQALLALVTTLARERDGP